MLICKMCKFESHWNATDTGNLPDLVMYLTRSVFHEGVYDII